MKATFCSEGLGSSPLTRLLHLSKAASPLSSFSLWFQGSVPSSNVDLSGLDRQGIADQRSPWRDARLASARTGSGAEPRGAADRPGPEQPSLAIRPLRVAGVLLPLTTDVIVHSGW